MRSLITTGIVLGVVASTSAVQAAQIRLDFDAFIPDARVANPAAETLPPFFTAFIGDDRDFDLAATRNGQARLFSQVILDTEASDPLVSSSTDIGTSVGFLVQDGVETSQSLKGVATGSVEAKRVDDQTILLDITARGTNPLIEQFIPPELEVEVPPAEYVYRIELTLLEDTIEYELTGTTRAYPNYSVFLEGSPILQKATASDNSGLLSVIEPVSASGSVAVGEPAAVNEPANLLGLCAAGLAAICYRQSKRSRLAGS